MKYREELITILSSNKRFMNYLEAAHSLNIKNYCVGAGAVRDTVWAHLHNMATVRYRDIDVVYYNKNETRAQEKEYEQQLDSYGYGVEWDVKNQALVHEWYQQKFGIAVEPYNNLHEAIGSWPELATSVAVYLDNNHNMQVIAPFGLEDLFNITLRRNPTRVTKEMFEARLASKKMKQRWPKLRVVRD